MPSKINQIYYQWYIQIIILYGSNTLPIKKLSHEEPLSFKVWQHVQQQLYLHYKVHWILCKMVGAPSFSEPYSCKQPPLHSPPKIRSSTSVNFHLPIHLCLFTNSSLQSPLTLPSSIPHQFLTFLVLHPNIPTIKTKNVFPTSAISLIQVASRDQGVRTSCEDKHCFDLSILSKSMGSDNRTHNHWFLIAQAQKIGVLQVVVSNEDASNWNDKPFNPPSLIPPTYCHYFHTLLIPSQKLTFLWKSVAWLDFHLKLTILM